MLYLLSGLYAALGVVFGVSGWSKLKAQREFVASLRPLRLLPARLLGPVAAAITAAELTVALGLGWAVLAGIAGIGGSGLASSGPIVGVVSLGLAGLLLTVLTAGVALTLHRGLEAPCACFGATKEPLRRRHLVRNGLLMAVALAGLVVRALVDEDAVDVGGAAVAVGGGVIAALLIIRFDDIVALLTPIRAARPATRAGT